MSVPIITIDGTSGVGKGTLGQKLQQISGFHFLDSGALYRILGWWWLQQSPGLVENDARVVAMAESLPVEFVQGRVLFAGQDIGDQIRNETVAQAASKIAVVAEVRQALLAFQQNFAKAPGLIADGRDMGTVVFPHADIKIFLQAKAQVRAQRRFEQLRMAGQDADFDSILQEILARDERDANRAVAPTRPAADALVIDTSTLNAQEVYELVLQVIESHAIIFDFFGSRQDA